MGLFSKKPKERTLWRGANSVLTNPLGRVIKPEFYRITSMRLYKSSSNAFRLGSDTQSLELFRITSVRVCQGPYQKVVGLGAGDIVVEAPDRQMVWRSVPRCKKVESRIWAAINNAKVAVGVFPA